MQNISYLEPPRSSKNNSSISECLEPFASWYCLNGATCFSVKVRDSTLYNCWCTMGFHGLRCEYKYLNKRQDSPIRLQDADHTRLALTQNHANTDDETSASGALQFDLNFSRQLTRNILVTAYNLFILLLMMVLLVIFARFVRSRLSPALAAAKRLNSNSQRCAESKHLPDIRINHDRTSVGFSPIQQEQQYSSHLNKQKREHENKRTGMIEHHQGHNEKRDWISLVTTNGNYQDSATKNKYQVVKTLAFRLRKRNSQRDGTLI